MIKVKRIDHVAIAVADRDGAAQRLVDLFGLCPGAREHVPQQQTDVAFVAPEPGGGDSGGGDGATAIEVIAPAGNAGLTRFLDKRGPGLHHVCFEVDDLPAALDELKAAGVRLIDESPRPGARGHQVAFLHPSSTGGVLFELCSRAGAAGAAAFALLLGAALSLAPRPALAQYGMGMPGGGMPPPPSGQQQPKDEGPAEQAPDEEGRPSDLEPLSAYTDQNKRRAQLFELDGYFRFRSEYMHNFNLSQGYTSRTVTVIGSDGNAVTRAGLPPFPTPLSCQQPQGGDPAQAAGICGDKDIATANIRLRLEPTLNVTDQVRVRAQIDVLDNVIMGSTPDSLAQGAFVGNPAAPIPFVAGSQNAPEVGQNGFVTSIRAKRAWAEIDTEFGSLRVGRMPWHFGRGMFFNDGRCLDCNGGTTVDRLAALTEIYNHQLMLALDFGSQGQTTQQQPILGYTDVNGYPIDLAQDDDVFQYTGAITKIDTPIRLRERIDRGEVVLNYGLQVVYRSQQATVREQCPAAPETVGVCEGVNAFSVQPNLWMKLHYRALTVEFEGSGLLGRMDKGGLLAAPGDENRQLTFRQFGWVLHSDLSLYRNTFFLGFETGGASGDQAEDPSQYLNHRWRTVRQPAGDRSIRDFRFSPEYHVDSILFRQLIGTVTNAVYVKPAIAYWFDLLRSRQIGLSGSFIYSIAQVPVSTPGNSLGYGLELNVGATYRNTAEGFYAGVTWGVLWPLAALERNAAVWMQEAADAKAAQVIRGFIGIKF